MSNNLFSDNQDLLFHFANLDLQEISRLREKDYTDEGGPADFDAVKKLYREKLEEIGRIGLSGNRVVISHSQNREAAEQLKERLLAAYSHITVDVIPTRGLDSFYAERHGLIVGF